MISCRIGTFLRVFCDNIMIIVGALAVSTGRWAGLKPYSCIIQEGMGHHSVWYEALEVCLGHCCPGMAELHNLLSESILSDLGHRVRSITLVNFDF